MPAPAKSARFGVSVRVLGDPQVWRIYKAPQVILFSCLFWEGRGISVTIHIIFPHAVYFGGPCSACWSPQALHMLLKHLINVQGRSM